jgi:hypothetical protein
MPHHETLPSLKKQNPESLALGIVEKLALTRERANGETSEKKE